MAKFVIKINGVKGEKVIHTPLSGYTLDLIGIAYPTAQQLAQFFAGEYCDSGTVSVRGNGERGLIARVEPY